MNTRYVFKSPASEMLRHYEVTVTDNFPARYNIAPSQPIAIIRQSPMTRQPQREFTLVRWGFVPDWSKDGKFLDGKALVNIRSETVAQKRSFMSAYRRRRCLIPANGFYEWTGPKGNKQPWLVHKPGGENEQDLPLFSFAGLWEHWLGQDGSELESAAFLTKAAPEGFTLHSRVPVIVPPEYYQDWLHADETEPEKYATILTSRQPDWQIRQVSREVSSWRNDGPHLLFDRAQKSLF